MKCETIIPARKNKSFPITLVIQYGIEEKTINAAIQALVYLLKLSRGNFFSVDCYVDRYPSSSSLSLNTVYGGCIGSSTTYKDINGVERVLEGYLRAAKNPLPSNRSPIAGVWDGNYPSKLFQLLYQDRPPAGFQVFLTYESIDQSPTRFRFGSDVTGSQPETGGSAVRWSATGGCAIISTERVYNRVVHTGVLDKRKDGPWSDYREKEWLETRESQYIRNQNIAQNYITAICLHELGHLFGLPHCSSSTCIMQAVQDTVAMGFHGFCSDCRRKLVSGCRSIKKSHRKYLRAQPKEPSELFTPVWFESSRKAYVFLVPSVPSLFLSLILESAVFHKRERLSGWIASYIISVIYLLLLALLGQQLWGNSGLWGGVVTGIVLSLLAWVGLFKGTGLSEDSSKKKKPVMPSVGIKPSSRPGRVVRCSRCNKVVNPEWGKCHGCGSKHFKYPTNTKTSRKQQLP